MSRVVVAHDVQPHARVGRGDECEEVPELDVGVPVVAAVSDPAGRELQRREQRRGPVALVVAGLPGSDPGTHRQPRGGAVQRLDLGSLVDADHHRVLRRVQVQPDDGPKLGFQLRIGAEREHLDPPRLHIPLTPTPGRPWRRRPRARRRAAATTSASPQLGWRRGDLIVGRRPAGPGKSPNASSPPAVYRLRQVSIVGPDTPTRRQISELASPSAANNPRPHHQSYRRRRGPPHRPPCRHFQNERKRDHRHNTLSQTKVYSGTCETRHYC